MNVWRLMAYHDADYTEKVVAWSRREGIVAVGWNTGDLRELRPTSMKDIEDYAEDANPNISVSNRSNAGRSLWKFYKEVQAGDLVILSGSGYRALVLRITGDYHYDEATIPYYYEHRRKADVVPVDPDVLWRVAGGVAPGENIRRAFVRCAHSLTDAEYAALIA